MSTVIPFVIGFAVALPGGWMAARSPEFGYWWNGFWAIVCVVLMVVNALAGSWGWAAWMAFCAVLNAIGWRNNRRKRKKRRAMAMIGAKTRAIRDAMVRKIRETAKPRPVLRPVPGGAS